MVYILYKFLGLDFLLETIGMNLLRFLLRMKKTGVVFSYLPVANKIVQDVTWKDTKRFKRIDCMAQRDLFKNELYKSFKDSLRQASKILRGKKVRIITNKFVFSILKELQQEGVLKIENTRYFKNKRQPSEKLQFVSTSQIWKNIINRRFWHWVLKKEILEEYLLDFST